MRPYRGLTKDLKRWAYGWYCQIENKHYIILSDAFIDEDDFGLSYGIEGFIEVIPETVGQYTGLKDKNDKEIYGGDIWKRGDFIAIIVFKYSQWYFETATESKCIEHPYFHSNAKSGIITGNIHQHPELIEKE